MATRPPTSQRSETSEALSPAAALSAEGSCAGRADRVDGFAEAASPGADGSVGDPATAARGEPDRGVGLAWVGQGDGHRPTVIERARQAQVARWVAELDLAEGSRDPACCRTVHCGAFDQSVPVAVQPVVAAHDPARRIAGRNELEGEVGASARD